MPRGAVLRQQRSRQRRAQLIEATLELLAEGGTRAVTHRAVARRAGLPPASTTYYFRSIDDLVREALALNLEHRLSELRLLLETALAQEPEPKRALARFAELLLSGPPRRALTQLELYLQAARTPELREPVRHALASFEAFAAEALAEAGISEPGIATTVVAVIDGVVLHELARADGEQPPAEAAKRLAGSLWAVLGPALPGPTGTGPPHDGSRSPARPLSPPPPL